MVRLCIKDLLPCFLRMLKLNTQTKASKSESGLDTSKVRLANSGNFWKKLKAPIKSYLGDVFLVSLLHSDTHFLHFHFVTCVFISSQSSLAISTSRTS